MKNVTYMLLFFFLNQTSSAEGVCSNQTKIALEQVIEHLHNHIRNIKAEQVSDNNYHKRANMEIPGAIKCVISENGVRKDTYAWKAELYQTADFDQARKKYSELYNQIHNTIIKIEGEKPVILNGKYETPDGAKKSNSIGFHVLPATGQMGRLKVELLLFESAGAWKIALNVCEHDGNTDFAAGQ